MWYAIDDDNDDEGMRDVMSKMQRRERRIMKNIGVIMIAHTNDSVKENRKRENGVVRVVSLGMGATRFKIEWKDVEIF